MRKDIIRRVRFTPYALGLGPTFNLTVWDTHRTDNRGQSVLGYRLIMRDARLPGHTGRATPNNEAACLLFEGEDFAGSPCHADDSDATVRALMGFLTLRPGDTDAEYFERYTPAQLDYCSAHAEALDCEVTARFGEG